MHKHDFAAFAADWIAGWNSHDIDRVLSHYAPDIVFLSPIAQTVVGNGRVVGIDMLRDYWGRALKGLPDLRFELIKVLAGYDCVTIYYRNHRGLDVAETCEFGGDGKVIRSFACYTA